MQKQLKTNKGVTTRGIEWTEYTWNPIAGCFHNCQWDMPDGKKANCYAEDAAEGVASAVYPEGFEHHYWHPKRLSEPAGVKAPSKIFVGSMADMFGSWVSDDEINQVLDVVRKNPHHVFQFLTKNAPRLEKFDFPANAWVGASSSPDYMFNGMLSHNQKINMIARSLKALSKCNAKVKWMSFEPLSWDVSPIVAKFPGAIQWAVIGAASNGPTHYPPAQPHVEKLLKVLDAQKVKVFFKGNLSSLEYAKNAWREDFPITHENLDETRELPLLEDMEVEALMLEEPELMLVISVDEEEMRGDGLGSEGDDPNV